MFSIFKNKKTKKNLFDSTVLINNFENSKRRMAYSMSCFLLPSSLCHRISMLMAKFWWGNGGESSSLHCLSWEKLTKPKCFGGLGFKDLKAFNLAHLAKQGWKLSFKQDALVSIILKARYFKNSDFMEAKMGYNPSYTWRSIIAGREVLQLGLKKKDWKWGYHWNFESLLNSQFFWSPCF